MADSSTTAASRVMVLSAIATLWLVGGLVYPLLTIASDGLSPIQLTAVRTTGAALMTTPLLAHRLYTRGRQILNTRALGPNIVAAIAFYPIGNSLLTYASARLPSSVSALSFSLLPVLAASVAALRGHRHGRTVWTGIVGSMICMTVVVGTPGAAVPLLPMCAALASVVCWFAGTEYWAARNLGLDLVVSVWVQLVIGSIACWITLGISGSAAPDMSTVLQPVIVILAFSQFIQHAAYLGIAGRVSSLVLTSFAFVNPVIAAIAGFAILQQTLTMYQVLASAALLVSVSLVVRASQNRDAAATAHL